MIRSAKISMVRCERCKSRDSIGSCYVCFAGLSKERKELGYIADLLVTAEISIVNLMLLVLCLRIDGGSCRIYARFWSCTRLKIRD